MSKAEDLKPVISDFEVINDALGFYSENKNPQRILLDYITNVNDRKGADLLLFAKKDLLEEPSDDGYKHVKFGEISFGENGWVVTFTGVPGGEVHSMGIELAAIKPQ